LSASQGRDHHLTNACFLLGGPIAGVDIGASSDQGMLPQPIDLASCSVDPGGELPKPDHMPQMLDEHVGLGSDPDLRVSGIAALLRG
jgi:hypothetical protein